MKITDIQGTGVSQLQNEQAGAVDLLPENWSGGNVRIS